MSAGHRELDHTADLALEVWGSTEEELLCEAARAIVAVLTGGAEIASSAVRDAEVDAIDDGDRLVRWLNEVLYLATVEGFVFAHADLDLIEGGGLRAQLHGVADARDKLKTEIKSATYHDLSLERLPDRVVARVVLDV